MLAIIIFDKKSPYWSMNGTINNAFVQDQISYMYDRVSRRGYMHIKEVYDFFGTGWDPYNNSNDCLFYDGSIFTFTCSVQRLNDTDYEINICYQV